MLSTATIGLLLALLGGTPGGDAAAAPVDADGKRMQVIDAARRALRPPLPQVSLRLLKYAQAHDWSRVRRTLNAMRSLVTAHDGAEDGPLSRALWDAATRRRASQLRDALFLLIRANLFELLEGSKRCSRPSEVRTRVLKAHQHYLLLSHGVGKKHGDLDRAIGRQLRNLMRLSSPDPHIDEEAAADRRREYRIALAHLLAMLERALPPAERGDS